VKSSLRAVEHQSEVPTTLKTTSKDGVIYTCSPQHVQNAMECIQASSLFSSQAGTINTTRLLTWGCKSKQSMKQFIVGGKKVRGEDGKRIHKLSTNAKDVHIAHRKQPQSKRTAQHFNLLDQSLTQLQVQLEKNSTVCYSTAILALFLIETMVFKSQGRIGCGARPSQVQWCCKMIDSCKRSRPIWGMLLTHTDNSGSDRIQ